MSQYGEGEGRVIIRSPVFVKARGMRRSGYHGIEPVYP